MNSEFPQIPAEVQAWLAEAGHGKVASANSVGGGCINNGLRLQTGSGRSFFLKTNSAAPPDMFAREAEGLAALVVPDGPRLPRPHLLGPGFLLLEDLAPAPRAADYWAALGRQLANLHTQTNPQFGFPHDNYIGSTPQQNHWTADGCEFFAEQRLLFQARLANNRNLLDIGEVRRVEKLCTLLPDLVPEQPASLIHGDLWGGNVIADERGQPALIDPAAHYGWAEAELAMTALFGGFAPDFYRAYEETRPLEVDYRGRFPIYNLYHLLNHLNLFGAGYHGQVIAILHRYT